MKIVECPRDAMQGIKVFVPTEKKLEYINSLLRVGFDTIDVGSFVSPRLIPQMQDTAGVLMQLDMSLTRSKLLAIVANVRGAKDAVVFDEITYLGYPFSVSETFQQRNANSSIEESLKRVEEIQALCLGHKKMLVVYLSMAFGNPYGDAWSADIVYGWARKLVNMGVQIISLADTIGVAGPLSISELFSAIIPELKGVEVGAHLHTRADAWREKAEAAYNAGCRRFDGAIKGFGGCPMAEDELVGNMPTEQLLAYFEERKIFTGLNKQAFNDAMTVAERIFL
jgi:hydroxymethylglutaryl-CoA lyase